MRPSPESPRPQSGQLSRYCIAGALLLHSITLFQARHTSNTQCAPMQVVLVVSLMPAISSSSPVLMMPFSTLPQARDIHSHPCVKHSTLRHLSRQSRLPCHPLPADPLPGCSAVLQHIWAANSPHLPTKTGGTHVQAITHVSPRLLAHLPVTTVPRPAMLKTSSTGMRKGLSMSRSGSGT